MSLTVSKAKILSLEKQRNGKLSSALDVLKTVNKNPTLSERLRVAGIKECKPEPDLKRNNSKRAKKRKNYYKKLYLEKATSRTFKSTTKIKRKFRNRTKNYLLPYVKEPFPDQAESGEGLSKNFGVFLEKEDPNIHSTAKETIFVSLDFLQDCQNYKRNIRKHKFTNPRFQKKTKNAPKINQNVLRKKLESRKVKYLRSPREHLKPQHHENKNFFLKSSEGKVPGSRHIGGTKFSALEKTEDKKGATGPDFKFPFEVGFQCKPFLHKMSQENIAKIDKRFLDSLLSIAKGMEKGDKTKEERETKKSISERHSHKKHRITGKVYFEGKLQKIAHEGNSLKNAKDTTSSPPNAQNESKSIVPYKELVSTKLPRDTAKSEVQIPPPKGSSGDGSKMKSEKNMSLSKPDADDTRKKRKNRNKIMKNSSDEFVEASFPSEVSKVADVKELWRRDAREKSENSLSSYSSCTVPEGEEIPEWKNLGLQSYRVLRKLVEQEVTKITPKPAKKDNTVEVDKENISKSENSKEQTKPKINVNKVKVPLFENSENTKKVHDKKENEAPNPLRTLNQTRKRQHYSVYEGKRHKPHLPNFSEGATKDMKDKLSLSEETGKNHKGLEKTPSSIVKNWSILNRLEQAFLVLGSPNFNNKDVAESNAVESKNSRNSIHGKKFRPGAEKLSDGFYKKLRKPRSKEAFLKKKNKETSSFGGSSVPKTPDDSFAKHTTQIKRIRVDNRVNFLKEKQHKSRFDKELKNDNCPPSAKVSNTMGDEGTNSKQKEKKTPRNTPESFGRRSATKSLERLKSSAGESRNGKREAKENEGKRKNECKTAPEQLSKPLEGKQNKFSKSPPKVTHRIQEKSLERKKTFNVIQMKEGSVIQPRKSKSCNKIEENYDLNGVKVCYSQTKTRDTSNDKTDLGGRAEKESAKRALKKMAKNFQLKEKPVQNGEKHSPNIEKPKSGGEKDFSRGNRDGIMKTNTKSKVIQEKKSDRSCPAEEEEALQQIQARKDPYSNPKKREIKERSILSMRLNQQDAPEERKKSLKVQEKSELVPPSVVVETISELNKKDLHVDSIPLQEDVKYNASNVASISANNFNVIATKAPNPCTETRLKLIVREFQDEGASEDPEITPSTSSMSNHFFGKRQSAMAGVEQIESNPSKKQQLWEKDIKYYHTIVREIMSHYKRIDGFLKQSDHLGHDSPSSVNLQPLSSDTGDELHVLPDDLQSLQEYRKKVIDEYQALPFFEYKSKLQQKKEGGTKSEDARKRNLQVVKDVKAGVDVDVKDFRLNIQKVLDSQLYVDEDTLDKRDEPVAKVKEISQCKSEKTIKQH